MVVKKKDTGDIFAMKTLKKENIKRLNHVERTNA